MQHGHAQGVRQQQGHLPSTQQSIDQNPWQVCKTLSSVSPQIASYLNHSERLQTHTNFPLATKKMSFGDANPDLSIPPQLSIVLFCFQLLASPPCGHIFTKYFIKCPNSLHWPLVSCSCNPHRNTAFSLMTAGKSLTGDDSSS